MPPWIGGNRRTASNFQGNRSTEFRGSAERGKHGGERRLDGRFIADRGQPLPSPVLDLQKIHGSTGIPTIIDLHGDETSNGFMIGIIIVTDRWKDFTDRWKYSFGEAKYRGERRVSRR